MICPVIFDIIDSNFMINVPFGKLKNIDWLSKFWFHQKDTKINLANTYFANLLQYLIYCIRHARQDATEMLDCYDKFFVRGLENSTWKKFFADGSKPAFEKTPVQKEFQRVVRATSHKEIFLQTHFKVCCKYLLSNVDKLFSTEKFFPCLFEIWKPLSRLVNQNAMEGTR